jgi:hypothetical protein
MLPHLKTPTLTFSPVMFRLDDKLTPLQLLLLVQRLKISITYVVFDDSKYILVIHAAAGVEGPT